MLSPVSPYKVLSHPPPSFLTLHLLTSFLLLPVLESSVTPAAGAGEEEWRGTDENPALDSGMSRDHHWL